VCWEIEIEDASSLLKATESQKTGLTIEVYLSILPWTMKSADNGRETALVGTHLRFFKKMRNIHSITVHFEQPDNQLRGVARGL
jgi:hypothetical protein